MLMLPGEGGVMRIVIFLAVGLLLAGCESFVEKRDASRQDRCQRANWAEVGERDGATTGNVTLLSDRYSYICGDMYNDAQYKAGFSKGFARRPTAPR
jgi:uncharacterized protein YceK